MADPQQQLLLYEALELRAEYEEPRSSRADVNYDDVGGMGLELGREFGPSFQR